MTTARRYESGRLVDDRRAATPALGWGKGDDESLPAAPDVPEKSHEPAKPVRRRPSAPAVEPAPVLTLPEIAPETVAASAPPVKASASTVDERIEDTSDMRKFLLRQMVRAARGEITTEAVKNIVTLSQQVYNATSLELKAAAILKDSERSIRALELVSPQNNGGD